MIKIFFLSLHLMLNNSYNLEGPQDLPEFVAYHLNQAACITGQDQLSMACELTTYHESRYLDEDQFTVNNFDKYFK